MDANDIFMKENDERFSVENEDYQKGLQNVIIQF
jgi:hypothetical protein